MLAPQSTPANPVLNHTPNNLQIAFGGIKGFGNKNDWLRTISWGEINTISKVGGNGPYEDDYMVTLSGSQNPRVYMTLFNQINNPAPGQIGAYITAPHYLARGTTLTFKGPNGADKPPIVLSKAPIKTTNQPIPVGITGTLPR